MGEWERPLPMQPQGKYPLPGPVGPDGPSGPMGPPRHVEVWKGVTGAGGLITFTFTTPFLAVPGGGVEITPSPNDNTFYRITAISTTAVTVRAFTRAGLTVLGITLLAFATVDAVGIPITATMVEP